MLGGGRLIAEPSSWLVQQRDLIHPGSRVLDVACGTGRNALWLASLGCRVHAIDIDPAKIAELQRSASVLHLGVSAEVRNLEIDDPPLGSALLEKAAYEVIVVVHYLHRPLFPALVRALAPGGLLVYETFTLAQAARGKPTNPAFLLQPGELKELVAPLEVLRFREGEFEGRMVAGVAARRSIDAD